MKGKGIKRLAGVNLKLGISCLAEGCKPRNERKLYQNFPHPQPLPISQLRMIPFLCNSSCISSSFCSFLLRKDTIWLRYAHVTKQSVVALCSLCLLCNNIGNKFHITHTPCKLIKNSFSSASRCSLLLMLYVT